jgi:hypothetical protein
VLLAGYAHADPNTRLGRLGERLGHQIVEEPVELRERRLDAHARDGKLAGRLRLGRGECRLREAEEEGGLDRRLSSLARASPGRRWCHQSLK